MESPRKDAEFPEIAEVAEVAEVAETETVVSVNQASRSVNKRSIGIQTDHDVSDTIIPKLGELVVELSNHLATVCALLVEQKRQVAELTTILHESDVKMMRLLNVPKEVKRLRYSMDHRCYCHSPKCRNFKSKGKRSK